MTILYHYCPTNSFEQIISNKLIRLSSLLLSNDYNEGKIVTNLIKILIESDDYSIEDRNLITQWLSIFSELFHGIGFCLSEEGDLLSQWRGYADDGHGISIGFNKTTLENLIDNSKTHGNRQINLKKVLYGNQSHFIFVGPIIGDLKTICNDNKYKSTIKGLLSLVSQDNLLELEKSKKNEKELRLLQTLLPIANNMFTSKGDAFSEEKEWRLLSNLESVNFSNVNFYAKKDKLIPYDSFSFGDFKDAIISKIILGPKHQTPKSLVENYMKEQGYINVVVEKSTATYR